MRRIAIAAGAVAALSAPAAAQSRLEEAGILQSARGTLQVIQAMQRAYGGRIYGQETPIALGGPVFERGHAVMVMCGTNVQTDAGTVLINFTVAPSWSQRCCGRPTADGRYIVNIYGSVVRED